IDWSQDGTRMFHVDSPTRRIDVFDYDIVTGEASGRRPFASTDDSPGFPDGLVVDADNRVWVALWNGGEIRCYESTGVLAHRVELPVRQPTSCTFGGPDLTTVFVTT